MRTRAHAHNVMRTHAMAMALSCTEGAQDDGCVVAWPTRARRKIARQRVSGMQCQTHRAHIRVVARAVQLFFLVAVLPLCGGRRARAKHNAVSIRIAAQVFAFGAFASENPTWNFKPCPTLRAAGVAQLRTAGGAATRPADHEGDRQPEVSAWGRRSEWEGRQRGVQLCGDGPFP